MWDFMNRYLSAFQRNFLLRDGARTSTRDVALFFIKPMAATLACTRVFRFAMRLLARSHARSPSHMCAHVRRRRRRRRRDDAHVCRTRTGEGGSARTRSTIL